MPKIQGKQIAESTITQDLLNLSTPSSGDTTSGATVDYVNQYVSTLSGDTVIGPAEDGTYTDGIFTDFTDATRVGVAVDRFNEMLLLLAPTPPNNSWDNVFSNLNVTSSEYSARALTSGTVVSNITTDTTPSFSLTDTVGDEANARALPTSGSLVFTMADTSGTLETETITPSSTGDASGIIQYTVADPYVGQSGKAGFWTGITAFSVTGSITTPITPAATQRTLTFTHPGSDSPETYNYYVDNATTPTVGTVSATMPSMTGYVSGVPTLEAGQTITAIGFTVTNAVSYFYNNSFYDITGTFINNDTANPPTTIPTTQGQSVVESGLSVTVGSGSYYDDDSFQFSVTARSANGASNTNTYTSNTDRIDTVSDESTRLTVGTGSYPATGWGGTFDETQSLVGTYTSELMMRNGSIIYPTGNYTTYGGPDYSSATGTRYVMYNLGTFSNNSAFTLNFVGSSGISTIGQANLVVEIIISGATSWVDGDAAYSGVGNPGSGADGVAAVVVGSSTATARRITFGSIAYSGAIIVRVGFTASGPSFSSLTATSLV